MKLYNIVKVYTSTVGTGTVTLGSAVPSFITFATAGVITGSTVSYAIEDGNNREVGTGVYTSGAETLTRTVVTSTNSNNAITLSGNAVVFITGLAADLSSDTAATANTLVIRNGSGNFALGTPTSGTLTNCTGLPVSTGISGLGANVATFLATPSSANLASAVTDETGTGALVFANTPTLVTPLLGTPTSGTLTNCTGLPISTGVSGLAANVATFLATPSSANLAAALTDETGTGANVFANTPTLVTPILGTPTSGTLTNCTGLPISTGVSGLGSNVATFLATPSSANLASAVTDETGSGALVFGTSPTIATPTITTSATVPLVIGGTGTTSTLTLRSTSGVGTTGADIIFQAGNNGASEIMRLLNGGSVLINKASTDSPANKLDVQSMSVRFYSGGATTDTNFHLGNSDVAGGQGGFITFHASAATPYLSINALSQGVAWRNIILAPSSGNVGIGTASPDALLTVNTIASFGDGAQTTPSIAHKGDLNTGFWFPAADNIAVSVGGVEAFRFDSAGRFQAGGTTGLERINAVGSYQAYGWHNTGAAANEKYWRHIVHDANRSLMIQAVNDAYNAAATPFEIVRNAGTYTTQYVRIAQDGGNVGIGTPSPAQKLDVVGNLLLSGQSTANQYITIGSGRSGNGFSYIDLVGDTTYSSFGTRLIRGTGGANTATSLQHRGTGEFQLYAYEAAPLVVYLNSAERMRIDSSGNVGIGTVSNAGNTLRYLDVQNTDTGSSAGAILRLITSNSAGTSTNSVDIVRYKIGLFVISNNDSNGIIAINNAGSECMRILSTGNVGIGTTNPLTKLQVGTAGGGAGADGNTTLSAGTLMVYATATSGAALTWNAYTNGGNSNTVMAQLKPRQDTSANYNLDVFCGTWNNNNNPGTAVATFQSTGNVGIGTSTIGGKLTIVSGDSATASNQVIISGGRSVSNGAGAILFTNSFWNSGFGAANIVGLDSGGSGGHLSFGTLVDGGGASGTPTEKMRILQNGNVGIGTSSPGNKLHVSGGDANGWVTFIDNSNNNARLQIGSRASNSASLQSIRIDTAAQTDLVLQPIAGNVLIGYTTSNGLYLLQVNSQIFATNATIATSDGRYKENISSIKSGLDVVGKLNPVSFTWKQHEIHNFDSGTQVGFIAQDVQEALTDEPYLESIVKRNEVELKDGTKEEFYGLSDAKLIPILVKAIQELKAEIDILKARN